MIESKSYRGKLDGVFGIWTDKKPKGLKEVEEITFYQADEGKVFAKDGEPLGRTLVLQDGEKIEDYEEIEKKAE